jgi:hypothetical protein
MGKWWLLTMLCTFKLNYLDLSLRLDIVAKAMS